MNMEPNYSSLGYVLDNEHDEVVVEVDEVDGGRRREMELQEEANQEGTL